MSKLIAMASSAAQVAIPNLRRHADPPALWGIVLLGSLLVNGVLVVAFDRYVQRLEPVTTEIVPITVDFFTIASPSSSKNLNPASTSPKVAKTINPPSAPAPSVRPSVPAVTKTPSTASSDISFNSEAKPSPLKRSTPTPAATPTTNAAPQSTSPLQPDPAASPTQASDDPPADDRQIATSGISLPDFTPPPDPKANPGDTTSSTSEALSLNRNATIPKFVIQVTVLPQGENQPKLVTGQHTQQTKTLPSGEAGCFVTPEALRNFNQPEEFALTLNETGTVMDAAPTTPNAIANKSYQQLAICTLKTLSFNPLLLPTAIEPSSSKLAVQVILQKQ